MDLMLLIARLLLAAVFVTAGLAKLADRDGSRQAVIGFGLPAVVAGPLAVLLPLAELGVAVALVPTSTAWWGALGALTLTLVFMLGIGYNLARGRQPDCHCFGQLHSSPAGWPTLIRNGALAAVAGFILLGGRPDSGASAVAWFGDVSTLESLIVLGGAVVLALLAAQAWLLVKVLQQNGRLLTRVEQLEAVVTPGVGTNQAPQGTQNGRPPGLPVGTPAPAFSLKGLHGETLTLDALRATGKPVMLVFTDPKCGPCNALLPDIGGWQREHANSLTLALISRGTADANRNKSMEHGLSHVLVQEEREVAEAYDAIATPTAVLVGADGKIASAAAPGADAIRALVESAVAGTSSQQLTANGGRPAILMAAAPIAKSQVPNGGGRAPVSRSSRVGQPAPELRLPDLNGAETDLASFRGTPTMVLFWNPGCGFCSRMLGDLKEWEAALPDAAPALLIVSTGTLEANKALGLRSTVVLDQNFATGRAFGVTGTPSAVLVDAGGNVASEPAVGAPAVLALARGEGQHTRP